MVAGWVLLFSIDLGQHPAGFFEDRVWLVRDGCAHLLLISDPWDREYPLTLDGDNATWRLFATWLADALERKWIDVPLRSQRDDEASPHDETQWLSQWILGESRASCSTGAWAASSSDSCTTPSSKSRSSVSTSEGRSQTPHAPRSMRSCAT